MIVRAQTTRWRAIGHEIHCVQITCVHARGGSHAAQRLQNAGKHLNLDLLPKHERPRKLSTRCNTLSFVCVPANINTTWSLCLQWYLYMEGRMAELCIWLHNNMTCSTESKSLTCSARMIDAKALVSNWLTIMTTLCIGLRHRKQAILASWELAA